MVRHDLIFGSGNQSCILFLRTTGYSKCDCDDPNATNNGAENTYCRYNRPSKGAITTAYSYPSYNYDWSSYYANGIASAYGVSYSSIWYSSGRRSLQSEGPAEIQYTISSDENQDLDTLISIAEDPSNVTI